MLLFRNIRHSISFIPNGEAWKYEFVEMKLARSGRICYGLTAHALTHMATAHDCRRACNNVGQDARSELERIGINAFRGSGDVRM